VKLPTVIEDGPCGAWMGYRTIQDGFFLGFGSTGGTSVMVGNGEACSGDQGGSEAYIQKDSGQPTSFPAYGTITVTVQGSTVTFSANGVKSKVSVSGYVYAVYLGYLTGVGDAGPFKSATFSRIAITTGGHVGGVRAWWLSTTQYQFRGSGTHVTASKATSSYSAFTITRYSGA